MKTSKSIPKNDIIYRPMPNSDPYTNPQNESSAPTEILIPQSSKDNDSYIDIFASRKNNISFIQKLLLACGIVFIVVSFILLMRAILNKSEKLSAM